MNTHMIQTELGSLPSSWSVCRMEGCLVKAPSYGINAPAVPRTDKLPAYVRITDITDDGRLASAQLPSVDSPHSFQYELSVGDIVLARTGASVGKSWMYDGSVKPLVYAGFLIKVTPNQQLLIPSFLAAYLTTGTYWNWVNQTSMRSGQPGINGVEYSQLLIPVPPISEQRAIATALSDVDALIAGLERLIAKKRDIKQAAMQQLLTGQTRLPGFSGEWEKLRFREIGQFRGGSGFPTDQQGESAGDYPFYKVSDMNIEGNETFMFQANNWISEATRNSMGITAFPADSIIFAKVGAAIFLERKKILSRPSCIDNNLAGLVLDKSRASVRFTHYVLMQIKLSELVSTTALPSLNGSVLANIPLLLPSLTEQTAISTVLSDMDANLSALESRLAKTRAIKLGMMQELLTGRTRL